MELGLSLGIRVFSFNKEDSPQTANTILVLRTSIFSALQVNSYSAKNSSAEQSMPENFYNLWVFEHIP